MVILLRWYAGWLFQGIAIDRLVLWPPISEPDDPAAFARELYHRYLAHLLGTRQSCGLFPRSDATFRVASSTSGALPRKSSPTPRVANSELSNTLRDQLMNLALQYDHLASSLEAPGTERLQNWSCATFVRGQQAEQTKYRLAALDRECADAIEAQADMIEEGGGGHSLTTAPPHAYPRRALLQIGKPTTGVQVL